MFRCLKGCLVLSVSWVWWYVLERPRSRKVMGLKPVSKAIKLKIKLKSNKHTVSVVTFEPQNRPK